MHHIRPTGHAGTAGRTGSAGSGRWRRVRDSLDAREWRSLGVMFGVIALLHVIGFGLLMLALRGNHRIDATTTLGIGTGVLAYTLGMRHAFDADHIAAIDNTTRKLISEGKRPLSAGFFFAMGHSSVAVALVVLLSFGVKALASAVVNDGSALHHYASLIGTTASAVFLLLIAALNLVVLCSIITVFVTMRRSDGHCDEEYLEEQLAKRGLMTRFFGSLTRSMDSSWKMYPLGLLFGLGFETATEVAMLILAGTAFSGGLPFWAVLSMPILFTAGMSLFDTLDGVFMNFAYEWAFAKPVRKIYYNITITGLSVAVAVFVGGIEVAQLTKEQLGLVGGLWDYVADFDINRAGYVIVGLFVAVWILALAIWKFGRVEQRWETTQQSRSGAVADA
ncbi:High-affinity nickel-transporter [Carbonactinospora thermoautotrophica]|uniref:Nickel/cobalt efflux system n=1 Tax=Carbonactinospora thermoautotrophica TaxID=1469144 RepID=A0A132MTV1_9ACTN|nr:HoxN/HupN/NixA family nickel/cobalt transporter [Carbonactinospora thermoautotrophica]KWX01263.1 High-affinity nickel-transporter [Carbonactinospora thermoautotrophica]